MDRQEHWLRHKNKSARSNEPDLDKLGLVAGALAVDEAFVEKDWHAMQPIAHLATLADDELSPVFSGGTSLLKGHGLIKRFSEDIDFKLILAPAFLEKSGNQQRKTIKGCRDTIAVPFQSVIATQAAKRSAGVSNPSVLRGRPLSCLADLIQALL